MYKYIVSADGNVKGAIKKGLSECHAGRKEVMSDDEMEYTVQFESVLEPDEVDEIMHDAVADLGIVGSVTVTERDD